MAGAAGADLRRWLLAIAASALALCAFAWAAPHLRSPWPLATAVLTFSCVAAEVLLVSALVPRLGPRALALAPLPIGVLLAVAWAGEALPALASAALVTASLLGLGTLAGGVVGGAIERPGHLLAVAVVSGLVDVFSVLHPSGPTSRLVRVEAAMSVLVLPWPILGTARIEPVLGVGDVAFAAIYAAATRRHGLSMRRTVGALAAGLAATLAVLLGTGTGIPALPFLGAAFLAAHPAARRLPPEDRRKALLALGLLAAGVAALFLLR